MRGISIGGSCALLAVAAWSCSSDTSTGADASVDGPGPADAARDTSTVDSGIDTGVASDASDSSAGDGGVVYNDIADQSKWTVFSLGPNVSFAANELTGATFDGKYVYFAPATYGIVVRYDTTASFTTSGSWTLFDMAPVDNGAKHMAGALFDGKFVYVVPADNSRAVRYDTTASFTSAGSWSKYNFAALSTEKTFGGVYDGRYVYVVPNNASAVIRHDTQGAGFTNAGSWDAYDVGALDAGASGFATGGFDGKYVYAVPQNGQAPIVARYDSTSTFAQAGSWATFDVSAVSAQARDFVGAVFDGRYMYFVPFKDQSNAYAGKAVRYDTTKPFAQTASWEAFDTSQVSANAVGFSGGQFDGRYIYFAPFGAPNGWGATALRFDSQGTFTDKNAWKAFDMTVLDAQAHAMKGVVYDGRYLYYVPWLSGIVTRFDTKSPPSLPKPTASFF